MLVNNAGVGVGAPVGEIETKRLDMQLDINLRSIVLFYRECVAMLLRGRRASTSNALVVNTSSISGKRGEGWLSVYSATKHGVVGWTEAMNKELGQQGIKSTALCPAFVDTPMTDFVKEQVAAEEMIRPEDIAESVRYLLQHLPGVRRAGDHVHAARRLAVAAALAARRRRRASAVSARRARSAAASAPRERRPRARLRRARRRLAQRSSPRGSASSVGCALRERCGRAARGARRSPRRAPARRLAEARLELRDEDAQLARASPRARCRPARVKRSHACANERKSVRPPRRCAASIGQTPPSPST